MPESKLGGMDSGNVFGREISAQEWDGAKAGTAQEWAQRRLARGRTGMNGYQIFAAYRNAAS